MKVKNELRNKYKAEATQMKAVSSRIEEICRKNLGNYENADYLKYNWNKKYSKYLDELSEHVNTLSEIYLVIESMVENNNITITDENGEECINLDELITVEELLDR